MPAKDRGLIFGRTAGVSKMFSDFSLQHFRFHLEPKARLHMPAYNKGNVIRGAFGSMFRRIVGHGNYKDRVRDRVREQKIAPQHGTIARYFSRSCRKGQKKSARN